MNVKKWASGARTIFMHLSLRAFIETESKEIFVENCRSKLSVE